MELEKGIWTEDIEKHPNKKYEFVYREYECTIARSEIFCTYYGGVQLPANHPYYFKKITDFTIDVHGGLCFSCHGYFSFSCCQINDVIPVYSKYKFDSFDNKHYWTFEEVKNEVKKMVDQFITIKELYDEFQLEQKYNSSTCDFDEFIKMKKLCVDQNIKISNDNTYSDSEELSDDQCITYISI
jgi:hypothetical protein